MGVWRPLPPVAGLMIANAAKHCGAMKAPLSTGTRPQICHRMFPLLIFARQQHGDAYLYYRPAPRGAFPKPFTRRLISSYSLLSPSSSNWEGRALSQRLFFRFAANPRRSYSHAIGPRLAPLPRRLSLLPVFHGFSPESRQEEGGEKAFPVISKPVQKGGC